MDKHIGRVGALAVALGIGTAIVAGVLLRFTSTGDTVFTDFHGFPRLAFDSNGIAYAVGSPDLLDQADLYALTPSGPQKVVDNAGLPVFGLDGTGYTGSYVGTTGDPGIAIITFDPMTAV